MYLFLDRYFSLSRHLTNFVCLQGRLSITKQALNLVPVLDTLTGTREELILNQFNHLSIEVILRLGSLVNFLLQNFQTLELVNVID